MMHNEQHEALIARMEDPLDDTEKAQLKSTLSLCKKADDFIAKLQRAGLELPDELKRLKDDEKILKGLDQQFGNIRR